MAVVEGIAGHCAHAGLVELHLVLDIQASEFAAVKGSASAGQAAFCLAAGHPFIKSQLDLVKVLHADLRRPLWHLFTQLDANTVEVPQVYLIKGFAAGKVEAALCRSLGHAHDIGVNIFHCPPG